MSMPQTVENAISAFFRPPFLVAVVLLGTAALVAGPIASRFDLRLSKDPLPLKKPLTALDASSLYPYHIVERHVMPPAVVEALGTDQYVSWTLEDPNRPADDPLRFVNLLVTYYTGGSNLVPHTPDVCYLGSGYSPKQAHENEDVPIRAPGLDVQALPLRICTFVKTAVFNRDEVSVVYTFFANGHFVNTRTGVRMAINDPTDSFAYFSKVELSFPRATRTQCLEGSRQVFESLLPVLARDHWPDLEAAEAATRTEPD
jgi:hypothetical protein